MVIILFFFRQVAAAAKIYEFFVQLFANTRQTDEVTL